MKVRICYTISVDDDFRAALNYYHDTRHNLRRTRARRTGLATRQEIKDWYEVNAGQCDDDIMNAWQEMKRRPHA